VPEARKDYITFASAAEGLDEETFIVVSLDGTEILNRPYRFEIGLVSQDPNVDAAALLKAPATLGLKQGVLSSDGRKGLVTVTRTGVVASFEQMGRQNEWTRYKAVLVPPLWRLSLSFQSRIFQDMTVPEIVEQVLKDAGIPADRFEFKPATRPYPRREYVVQYEETDLDFVHRWLEHEGMLYWFQEIDGDVITVFGDAYAHYHDQESVVPFIQMEPESEAEETESAFDWYDTGRVTEFASRHAQIPKTVVLKDYNWRRPTDPLEVECEVSPDGIGVSYEYNNHYKTAEEGNLLARIRAEEIRATEIVFEGESTDRTFHAGEVVHLAEHYRADFNAAYLLTEVRHRASQDIALATNTIWRSSYANTFRAILADPNLPFRPERDTPWPCIKGVMNAIVDGAGDGAEAEMDSLGRYKVRLPLDRSDASGGEGSRYVRMAQPNAGKDVGLQFPLYPGTEVILTHVDGDPDRPIIAGAVPNADTPSPVGTSNHMDSVIQTKAGKIALHGDPEHPQTVLQSGDSMFRFGSGSGSFIYSSTEWGLEKNNFRKQLIGGLDYSTTAFLKCSSLVGYPWVQFLTNKALDIAEGALAAKIEQQKKEKEDKESELTSQKLAAKRQSAQDAAKEAYVTETEYQSYEDEEDQLENTDIPAKQQEVDNAATEAEKEARQAELDDLEDRLDEVKAWLASHHTDQEKFAEEMADADEVSLTDAEEEEIQGSQVMKEFKGPQTGLSVAQVLLGIIHALILKMMGKTIASLLTEKMKKSRDESPTIQGAWKEHFKGQLKKSKQDLAEVAVATALSMFPFGTLAYTLFALARETKRSKNPTDQETRKGSPAFQVWRKEGRLTGATMVGWFHDGENIDFFTEIGKIAGSSGGDVMWRSGNRFLASGKSMVELSGPNSRMTLFSGADIVYKEEGAAPYTKPNARLHLGDVPGLTDAVHAKLNVGKTDQTKKYVELDLNTRKGTDEDPGTGTFSGPKIVINGGENSESVIELNKENIFLTNGNLRVGIATKADGKDAKCILLSAGQDGKSFVSLDEDGNATVQAEKGICLQGGKTFVEIAKDGDITLNADSKKIILNAAEITLQGKLKDATGNEIPATKKPASSKLKSAVKKMVDARKAIEKMQKSIENDEKKRKKKVGDLIKKRIEELQEQGLDIDY